MAPNNIMVYARLKKERKKTEKCYDVVKRGKFEDIVFYKSASESGKPTSARFSFAKILNEENHQQEIFELTALPVVTSVLQGFNGTIFAYGQTGSGKTYTITGSSVKYAERGIIPRSLQHIFSTIEKTDEKPTLYISYMEIYNEMGYDLLSPREHKTATFLEELPRVEILEDKKGEVHLRNLSVIPITTEKEAMRLLFLGDTNRVIAETPLNEYSSRSHCIFTIYIYSRQNSANMVYSKLNLVDLAGSERVYKSKITGNTLNEAKYINLSLHFLQQVILALSEFKRTHIPYRNSLMTLILKDSLAGNCLTVMLATLAVDKANIQESISTCKFAQRVLLIRTDPVINEVSDPYQEISLLKNEIEELRKQLTNRKSTLVIKENSSLTVKQKQEIENNLNNYLSEKGDTFKFDIDLELLPHYFSFFKNKITNIKHEENKPVMPTTNKFNIEKSDTTDQMADHYSLTNKSKQESKANPKSAEIEYYLKQLSYTYEKAKSLALLIEDCQVNIRYIREKMEIVAKAGDSYQKCHLKQQLESQQNLYRSSLIELNELKNETLQLEAGLAKAKTKLKMIYEENDNLGKQKTEFSYFKKDFNIELNDFSKNNNITTSLTEPNSSNFKQKCDCHDKTIENSHIPSEYYCKFPSYSDKCCGISNISCLENVTCNNFLPTPNISQTPFNNLIVRQQYLNEYDQCKLDKINCCQCDLYLDCQGTSPKFGNILTDSVELSELELVPHKLDSTDQISNKCHSPKDQEIFYQHANDKPDLFRSSLTPHCNDIEDETKNGIPTTGYELFLDTDSEEFKTFIGTIELTGDEEIDKDICSFYRTKFVN